MESFLSNGGNKKLIKFIAEQHTQEESIRLIEDKEVYVSYENKCIVLSLPASGEILGLMCS